MKRVAMRTCVGCRQVLPQSAVLRLAAVDQAPFIVPDATQKLGGRGVWLEPNAKCFLRAEKKGGFRRALRRDVRIDLDEVKRVLSVQLERRLSGLLGGGFRARKVVFGTDSVRQSLEQGRAQVLGVAIDAAGSRVSLSNLADRIGRRCVVHGTKAELGAIFGRGEVGVYGIEDLGIGEEVIRVTTHLAGLRDGAMAPYEDAENRLRTPESPASDQGGDRENA